MEAIAAALIMIFCTPMGWAGIFAVGCVISLIREGKGDE